MTSPRPWWARPAVALSLALASAAAVAAGFRFAWAPPWAFYAYNVPIAVPFAAFFLDRAAAREGRRARALDALVLALALARVVVPPLPFVSGHALFCAYATLTAHERVLRWSAAIVLAQVAYTKLFLSGGWRSAAAGALVAAAAAWLRARWGRAAGAAPASGDHRRGGAHAPP